MAGQPRARQDVEQIPGCRQSQLESVPPESGLRAAKPGQRVGATGTVVDQLRKQTHGRFSFVVGRGRVGAAIKPGQGRLLGRPVNGIEPGELDRPELVESVAAEIDHAGVRDARQGSHPRIGRRRGAGSVPTRRQIEELEIGEDPVVDLGKRLSQGTGDRPCVADQGQPGASAAAELDELAPAVGAEQVGAQHDEIGELVCVEPCGHGAPRGPGALQAFSGEPMDRSSQSAQQVVAQVLGRDTGRGRVHDDEAGSGVMPSQ
ncbi:hypothetical protein ACFFX0_30940 [Citricoccus parietis]|uniref:Uncharacterized protein n=1 Tax=Citricoccus parietis TaxID=592307 RepID=A0ABV5G9P0_9MICC